MNKELKRASTWLNENNLSVTIDKTKWTIFYPTSKKRFMPTKFSELFIDGITLERETVTWFLIVFRRETVTWLLGVFIDVNITISIIINTFPKYQHNFHQDF